MIENYLQDRAQKEGIGSVWRRLEKAPDPPRTRHHDAAIGWIILLPELKRPEFWKHCGSKREGIGATWREIVRKSSEVKIGARGGNVGLFRRCAQVIAAGWPITHNLKVVGSNPAPATKLDPTDQTLESDVSGMSLCYRALLRLSSQY
jgi:hypothetical protein